jgi:hypothetical protein
MALAMVPGCASRHRTENEQTYEEGAYGGDHSPTT